MQERIMKRGDNMPFQTIRNDITKVEADVIVNTANTEPVVGDGTDIKKTPTLIHLRVDS